jgi:predicted nucleic acid-binding protein
VKRWLVDTGVLYALADRDDGWHERAASCMAGFRGRLLVTSAVIPEVCYLLNTYLGRAAERKFISSLKQRELSVEHFNDADLGRIEQLLDEYADANIGFVDAANVAIAERLKITEIVTTDRRHFAIFKPKHCPAFFLLP